MFKYFKNQAGGSRSGGLDRFKTNIEYLLGINIDYLAYVRSAVCALVDRVDHVTVNIPYEICDPKYIDKPGWPKAPSSWPTPSAPLGGGDAPRCYGGYPKPVTNWGPVMNCTRALVYVRSRKGKLVGCCGSNDYVRAARQQKFVFEAIKRVTDGYNSSITDGLRQTANSNPSSIYDHPWQQ